MRALWALVGLALGSAAQAHHSSAQFDTRTEITIEGVITEYDYRNPHVYMVIETSDEQGRTYEQRIEAGASSVLLPLGLTPDSLHPGDRVTLRANPNRGGVDRTVLGRDLVKEDGTELPLIISARSVRQPSTAVATSLEGTWFSPRSSFFGMVGGRRGWQLTDAGRAAADSYDSRDTVHADCIPVTAPTLMVYPVTTTIEIQADRVIFNIDWMASQRIVYMDGRDHPADGERTLHGHSIGHWEGETLVVDTVQYADHKEGTAMGLPSGAGKHTVERFSLSADGRQLDYAVVLEDPEYLVAPISYAAPWDYRPDLEPTGLACDLDVARRFLRDE